VLPVNWDSNDVYPLIDAHRALSVFLTNHKVLLRPALN
jgi:hypothetical protein